MTEIAVLDASTSEAEIAAALGLVRITDTAPIIRTARPGAGDLVRWR